jgi:hypothetical protein
LLLSEEQLVDFSSDGQKSGFRKKESIARQESKIPKMKKYSPE